MSGALKSLVGVVVSAGKMQRAVKVRVAGQTFNSFLQKQFSNHRSYLVSDPNDSIRLGDVVRFEDEGRQLSRHINHVVSEIVSPWGPAVHQRPPVLSAVERHALWQQKYDAKVRRRREKELTQLKSGKQSAGKSGKREGSREPRAPINAKGGRETREIGKAKKPRRGPRDDKVEGRAKGAMNAS